MQFKCFNCKTELEFSSTVISRSATCEKCDSDVRCCFNCKFYSANSYNECNEPIAERVVEKDRSTFCDYFSPGNNTRATEAKNALASLDDLFKK
jgi:hypothetical protein